MNSPITDTKQFKQTSEFLAHKKQRFWQIWFPFIIGLSLIIGLMVLIILGAVHGDPRGLNSKWASLILIIMIVLASILTLLTIGLLVVLIVYLAKGIHGLPPLTNQGKYYASLISQKVLEASDKIAQPIVAMGGWSKSVETFFKSFSKKH